VFFPFLYWFIIIVCKKQCCVTVNNFKFQFIGEEARKTRLGNFLKKVPQAPQKLPEKIGKNSHIAFFKWVNRLHLSFF